MLVFRALTSESPGLFPVHLLSGLWTIIVHQHQCSILSGLNIGQSGPLMTTPASATSSRHTGRSSCRMVSNLLRPMWARLWRSATPSSAIKSRWILWGSEGRHHVASMFCTRYCCCGDSTVVDLLGFWACCLPSSLQSWLLGLLCIITASLGKLHGIFES